MQEQLDRIECSLAEIRSSLDLLLDNAGKEQTTVAMTPIEIPQISVVDTSTGEILDNENWPEWFSLGHGIKGWKVSLAVAEKWRVDSGFSEEYCLDKVYAVRSRWDKDWEKKGRNPYSTFQQYCRQNWGSSVFNGLRDAVSHTQAEAERIAAHIEDQPRLAELTRAAREHERELLEAEEAGNV